MLYCINMECAEYAQAGHQLCSECQKVALSDTAPPPAVHTVLATAQLLFQHLCRLTSCHALALTSREFSAAFQETVRARIAVVESLAWRWGCWSIEVRGNGLNQLACNFTGEREFPLPVDRTPDDQRASYYPALCGLLDSDEQDQQGMRVVSPRTCWMRQWDQWERLNAQEHGITRKPCTVSVWNGGTKH